MSPDSSAPGSTRSAAVVNEEIRALVVECGGWLYGEHRDRYEQLVAEWAAAMRDEVTQAA